LRPFFFDGDDEAEKNLNFADLMNLVLDLRGSNTATVKDVVDLRRFMKTRFTEIEQLLTNQPPSCVSNSRPNCSIEGLSAEPQSNAHEFSAFPALQQAAFTSLLPPSDGCPLEARNGSMNFKTLVDSSLSLLLNAHEREVAAMKAQNGCLQALYGTAFPVAQHGPKDLALSADLEKPRTTASEHAIVPSESKEGQISENGHSCMNDLGVPQSDGLAATGPVWEPPAAPVESSSKAAASASLSPSTQVGPVVTGGSASGEQSELVYIGVRLSSHTL